MRFIGYKSNEHLFTKPLDQVFTGFYSVEDLWWPVRMLLYPSLGLGVPPKRPKKEILVKQLCEAFGDPGQMQAFVAAAAPETRAVWELLAWNGDLPLDRLEKDAGVKIARFNEHRLLMQPWLSRLPEFPFVVLRDEFRFYGSRDEESRRGVTALLPPAVREAFRGNMPKPKGYHIEPVADPPPAEFSYRCDGTAPEALRFVAEYIEVGNLKLTKAGKIRKASLREMASMIDGGEFFGTVFSSENLEFLRTSLVASFLNGPGKTAAQAVLSYSPDGIGKAFRLLLIGMFTNADWIRANLLDHLGGHTPTTNDGLETLFAMFSRVETEGWVTAENLERYAGYRNEFFDIFDDYSDIWLKLDPESDGLIQYYGYRVQLYQNAWDFFTIPLMHGMAFLLASMGFAEIRYNAPHGITGYMRTGKDYLTPFDGLVAIRLTPLGAYAFGKTEELEVDASARDRVRIVLNEQRLTLTCHDPDRMIELLLNDYTEKISEGCYRMTRQSLLRGCRSARDVAERIEHFKNRIPAEIPPLWQKFFDDIVGDCVALEKRPGYVFYRLADNPELRRLFLSDPVLRKLSIKTAGPGVAIKKDDVSLVSRRLAALGYLMQ